MKIAKVKLPDGRVAKFQVSDDATEQDVMNFVKDFKFDEATNESVAGASPLADVQPMQEMGERRELEQRPVSKYLQQGVGATQNLLQGASVGLADEVQGALKGVGYGIGASLTGREPIMQAAQRGYREGTDTARQEEQQFSQDMPKTALALNIAGGFANPLNKVGAGYIGRGAGTASKIGRGAIVGAGMGAGYGAGSSEEGERLSGAGIGGAVGGVTSGALGLLAPTASAIGRKIKKPTVVDAISDALKTDKTTVQQLKNKLNRAGEAATVADIAGDEVKVLGKSLTEQKGTSKKLAEAVFDTRQAKQADRIYEAGKKLMGGVGKTAYETSEELAEIKRVKSQPLYEQAYKKNIPIKHINHLLDRPPMKKAMTKAIEFLKTETGQDVDVSQFVDKRRGINTRFVDDIKRGLDDIITQSKTPLGDPTNETRINTNFKNKFLDIIDEINPDYKKARDVFAGYAEMGNSLDLGKNFLKGDTAKIAFEVKQMNNSEKQMFVEGVLDTLREMLEKPREGINKASQILTPNKLKALKTAFPDEKSFKEFENMLRFEDKIARTRFSILGKYKSNASVQEVAKVSGDQLGFFANLATGNLKWAAGHGIRDALRNTFNKVADLPEPQRNKLGRMLFSPNKRQVNQALDALAKDMPNNLDKQKQLELLRRMFSLSITGQSSSELMEE